MTPTKPKPLNLTAPEVRAILDGRKTQFRVPVKIRNVAPTFDADYGYPTIPASQWIFKGVLEPGSCCPEVLTVETLIKEFPSWAPYPVGTRLWVKETWADSLDGIDRKELGPHRFQDTTTFEGHPYKAQTIFYKADNDDFDGDEVYWLPSSRLPQWASRLTLVVTSVKVERLGDISENDAAEEGAGLLLCDHEYWDGDPDQYRKLFRLMWDQNPRHRKTPYDPGLWVFAYGFEVVRS